MKQSQYEEVVERIKFLRSRNCLKRIAEIFPNVSPKTLGSIYSQDYQKRMKKSSYKFHNPKKIEEYYRRYRKAVCQKGEQVLLNLADEADISPALMARLVLDRHLSYTQYGGESVPKAVLSRLLKDTNQITDPVLAHNVHVCVISDDVYGPVVDTIKRSIGLEYEDLLKDKIEEQGLAYLGEDQLRSKGYDKTPDFKLEVPIAVDGHVVNWIESKASFGDEDSHRGYLKDQFWSYWNRFGPGLVIYWFGFIDELDSNREKGILLMDRFPEDVVKMQPLSLTPHFVPGS